MRNDVEGFEYDWRGEVQAYLTTCSDQGLIPPTSEIDDSVL